MRDLLYKGLRIRVEYDRGDKKPWRDDSGAQRFTVLKVPYGYVKGTKGTDGDDVDVYVGPSDSDRVYVIKQMKKGNWSRFDEEKCMLGCVSAADAKALYLQHMNDDRFFGGIKELDMDTFKERLMNQGQEGKKIAGAMSRFAMQKLARKHELSDKIDDVGIGILAAPYAGRMLGSALSHAPGRLGAAGKAIHSASDKLHDSNAASLAGLALVAPGVTHRLADAVEHRNQKVAVDPGHVLRGLQNFGSRAGSALKGLKTYAGRALGTAKPGVPASAPVPASPAAVASPKPLFRPANIAKAGVVGTAALGLYGAKKTIDAATNLAGRTPESLSPGSYQGPRVY